MQELAEYIRGRAEASSRALPCAAWICDWIAARTGVDPIADLRPRWSKHRVLARIRQEGGLVAMTQARLAAMGLVETTDPRPGDVGIVAGHLGPTLAIRMECGWAGRSDRGVTVARLPTVLAWSVPCPR